MRKKTKRIGLAGWLFAAVSLFSGCSEQPKPTSGGNGIAFTNATTIKKYLAWQVDEGMMEVSTNASESTNQMTISYVWLSDDSAAKLKEWLKRESR